MRFSTPARLSRFFYLGVDTSSPPGDERFGLAIGRLYLGHYGPDVNIPTYPKGWAFGILDSAGSLR